SSHLDPKRGGLLRRRLASGRLAAVMIRRSEDLLASSSRDPDRARAAALSTARALGLSADEAQVVQVANRITLRVLPADVLVRVAPAVHGAAALEVDLAAQLAATSAPIGLLEPRVPPRVYERDDVLITF